MDDCSLKMAFKAFTLTQTNGLPHSKQTWLLAFPIFKANMTRPPGAVSHKVCILEAISSFVPTYRPNQSDITRLETHSLAVLGNSFSHIKSLPRNPGVFLDLVILGPYSTLHDIANGGWFTMIHELWMRFVATRFVKIPSAFHRRGQFYPEVGRDHVAGAQIIPKSFSAKKSMGPPAMCAGLYSSLKLVSYIYNYIHIKSYIYYINIRIYN